MTLVLIVLQRDSIVRQEIEHWLWFCVVELTADCLLGGACPLATSPVGTELHCAAAVVSGLPVLGKLLEFYTPEYQHALPQVFDDVGEQFMIDMGPLGLQLCTRTPSDIEHVLTSDKDFIINWPGMPPTPLRSCIPHLHVCLVATNAGMHVDAWMHMLGNSEHCHGPLATGTPACG